MNTIPNDELTQALLEAARKLREHQHSFIHAAQAIAVVETKKRQAEAVLSDAELELAEADAIYATTRLKVLQLIREKRRLGVIKTTEFQKPDVRVELWRICATGTDEEIIAMSAKYGEQTRRLRKVVQAHSNADADLRQSHEDLAAASTARKTAVQKRGKAKAELQDVEAELNTARTKQPAESLGMFELEKAVVDAACALTGTSEMQYTYSYAYTPDLGISGPGLELPRSEPTAEDNERFWEQHGYGAKREPAREE